MGYHFSQPLLTPSSSYYIILLYIFPYLKVVMVKFRSLIFILGALTTLFDTGNRKMEPLLIPMQSGELAVCRDEVTIFLSVNKKGEHQQKHAVTWSDVPQDLEFYDPYIIAVLPKHIEICSRSPQAVVQRINASGTRKINRGPNCYASSVSHVWRLVKCFCLHLFISADHYGNCETLSVLK